MKRVEKTVFLSYRRTNEYLALAIYQSLKHEGYDVFFDYVSIPSGDFETVIVENILARAHFVVILTPSALERCDNPGDLFRREIETALDTKRNIVPLMMEGFDFGVPAIANHLTGKLATLRRYNALPVSVPYFNAAMERLRTQCLNVAVNAVVHPASISAQQAAKDHQAAADTAPAVQEEELTAQEWFERGFNAVDPDEKLRCYSKGILLKPDVAAYNNRGLARAAKGDLDGALQDYAEAIRLKPDEAAAYSNRALAREAKGDLDEALQDYAEAIRLKPDYAAAYYNRGNARKDKALKDKGDLDGALHDYAEAIRLEPGYAKAYHNRGVARAYQGDLDRALQDFAEAIRLAPDYAAAYYNRGNARREKGDLDGAQQDFAEAIRLKESGMLRKG